ncbi:phage tail tape measure protein [Streptomyces sp. NBC_01571]|uniref:phage tail tape measure protein n=1 Tax=Streptomyces sp. NBC_01571 TaxID=2975883 RepID=UPI0022598E40|nr:phage tail tape measure protein [Streptomyces sp. NBC_01571]MCX4578111.1 phage tail tape measure protein [Streptomyces sp. NBC_01571]
MASDTSLVFNLVARDQASEQLGSMKEKFSNAGTAIGAALGVGVGASFVSAMDVEAANDKLAAQLGVGQAEAANLAKVSANVYKNAWGESTEDVNDAIRNVYQNIGDTSKAEGGLQGITTKVIALRDTFDQDLGGVTAAVGQMLKTGLAQNADQAMDIITAGFQKGVNKADDFLDTLNEYGTQFRDLGLDGATATGILKQGLQAGARDADLVADAMKELNIRVQDQSAAKGLKSLGLNAHDMAEAFAHGGPKARAALQTITDKLRGVTDPTKRYALAQQLLGTQSEDLSKALYAIDPSKAVKGLGDVSGAADKMTKTLGDNPKAALEGFQRTATMTATQVAGTFVNFAMKNKEIFGPLAGILAGVAVAVLAVSAAEKVYNAGKTIGTVVTKIWNASIWESNAALLANPMTWIVIGIVALIAVIVLIATKTTWFQQIWSAAWGGIKTAAFAVWDWIKTNWPYLLGIIAGPIGLAVGWVIKHWDTVKKGTASAWNAVVSFVKAVPGKLLSFFLNWTLPGLVIKHWNSIKSGTIRIATAIVSWVAACPGAPSPPCPRWAAACTPPARQRSTGSGRRWSAAATPPSPGCGACQGGPAARSAASAATCTAAGARCCRASSTASSPCSARRRRP